MLYWLYWTVGSGLMKGSLYSFDCVVALDPGWYRSPGVMAGELAWYLLSSSSGL